MSVDPVLCARIPLDKTSRTKDMNATRECIVQLASAIVCAEDR